MKPSILLLNQGYNIVASFMLKQPASFLKDYILQLQGDIFDEISFSTTNVEILSLQPLDGSNTTKVVFAVDSDVTTQSLIRASFVSIVTHQSFFHLSTSFFDEPFSFEVLKFKGGITASPEQKAFLMQKIQILFNFTLNFSIDQILYNFDELTSQLKSGLHLAPYENLYISLTNHEGSTVAPPTTVQSRVVLAMGVTGSLKKKLINLIKRAEDSILDFNKATDTLELQKRRIYDITNVIGLIEKKFKNRIQWKYGSTFIKMYFPIVYDIKHLIRFCNSLHGGLNNLAELLEVERVGICHQAGSDSLLTCCTFIKLKENFFNGLTEKYAGVLYGLDVENEQIAY